MGGNKISTVFFDLDGTLLDTAPDLYTATLRTLKQLGRTHNLIPFEQFRPHVHTGTTSMLSASLGIDKSDPDFTHIRSTLLQHYRACLHEKTTYFTGVPTLLLHLDQHAIPWGIVTSKPAFLTNPLLTAFGLHQRSQCIVSGDTVTRKKPQPDALLYACQLTHTTPHHALYVGDTQYDMQAARAADMVAVAALYGYHPAGSQPQQWPADYWINTPLELLDILKVLI